MVYYEDEGFNVSVVVWTDHLHVGKSQEFNVFRNSSFNEKHYKMKQIYIFIYIVLYIF